MELLEVKAVALLALLGLAYAGGVLPLRVSASPRSEILFSLSNAFAGGLFLAVGLIHMLGEADTAFREADIGTDYPVALAIAAAAFLAVLLLEAVVGGQAAEPGAEATGEQAAVASSRLRARLLTILLTLHSLISGIALGAETTVAATVAILLALMSHKGPEGYALGTSLYQAGRERPAVVRTVMAYAVMTPIGIVIGSVLAEVLTGRANLLVEATFDALAGGSFLYLATLGILKEEFSRPVMLGRKYGLALAGAGLIAVVSAGA